MKKRIVSSIATSLFAGVFYGDDAGAGDDKGAQGAQELAALQAKLSAAEGKISEITEKYNTAIKTGSSASAEQIAALTAELADLKTFKAKSEEEAKQREIDKQSDGVEKLKLAHAHELSKRDKALDDMRAEIEALKTSSATETEKNKGVISAMRLRGLKGDIRSAAAQNNAYNPDQIVNLVLDEFEYNDELDRYIATSKDAKGKTVTMEVSEFIDTYLKDEKNANLVKSDAKGGSGGQGSDGKGKDDKGKDDKGKDDKGKGKDGDIVDNGNGTSTFGGLTVKNEYLERVPVDTNLEKEAKNAGYSVTLFRFQKAYRLGQRAELKNKA